MRVIKGRKQRKLFDEGGNVLRPLMTPDEAALYINVPKTTLRSWRRRGVGPAFIRISARLLRYSPEDLDAYLLSIGRVGRRVTPRPRGIA